MKLWKLGLALGLMNVLGALHAFGNDHAGPMGDDMAKCMPHSKCGPKGVMHSNLVATTDGGVVVLCGKHLVKFDKNLKVVKEVEMECACCAKKGEEAGQGMGDMCPRHGDKHDTDKKAPEAKPADAKKAAPEVKPAEPAKK